MSTALGTQLGTYLGTTLGQDDDAGELAALEYYLARNLFSWIRADYRTLVDYGGGDIRVSAFPDKVALVSEGAVAPNARSVDPAHAFVQGTQANQVLAPTAQSSFNGQLVINNANDGATYDSTLAASSWVLHWDSHAIYTACRMTGVGWGGLFGTKNTGVERGVYCSLCRTLVAQSQTCALGLVGNGGGAIHASNEGAVGSAPANVSRVYSWIYRLNTDYTVTSDVPKTVSVTGTASGTAPNNTGRLFNSFGANFRGMWAELQIFNRLPTSAEQALVSRYFLLRYGLS